MTIHVYYGLDFKNWAFPFAIGIIANNLKIDFLCFHIVIEGEPNG